MSTETRGTAPPSQTPWTATRHCPTEAPRGPYAAKPVPNMRQAFKVPVIKCELHSATVIVELFIKKKS